MVKVLPMYLNTGNETSAVVRVIMNVSAHFFLTNFEIDESMKGKVAPELREAPRHRDVWRVEVQLHAS